MSINSLRGVVIADHCCKETADLYRKVDMLLFNNQQLSAQVQALTFRLNALSDKVSDQAVVLGKLVD